MQIINKILRWLIRLAFLTAVLLAFLLWRAQKIVYAPADKTNTQNKNGAQINFQEIIPLENPRPVNFQWKYNGVSYELNEIFYGSLYNFYQTSPKAFSYQGTLPENWKKDYYAMFLGQSKNDNSIAEIAAGIEKLGKQKELSDDQIAELALAFVQSIPYDSARAKEILAGNGSLNYPYETLYENKGVCSDKSFLLVNILNKLGYGTAIFEYARENHMAVGIRCPQNYSNYDSGYCYAETTAEGMRVGMIPEIDPQEGKALGIGMLEYFNENNSTGENSQKLESVKIFLPSEGKTYQGIIQSLAIAKKIDGLRREISALEKNLLSAKKDLDEKLNELNALAEKLNKLQKKKDYESYNDLIPEYNDTLDEYKKASASYNKQVKTYNEKIKTYNYLVNSF